MDRPDGDATRETPVTVLEIVSVVLAVALTVYLFVALLDPERFQ